MTIVKEVKIKPIDFLYRIIGGEDRRLAPEGLAELYDDLVTYKKWVDEFNGMIDKRFPKRNSEKKVADYLKKYYRRIAVKIIGRERF